jgi:hypothetical protein
VVKQGLARATQKLVPDKDRNPRIIFVKYAV